MSTKKRPKGKRGKNENGQAITDAPKEKPVPGSKEAMDKVFGSFKDEDDLEETLAALAAIRAAWPNGPDK